jgi:hypothetical protein
VEIYLDCEIRIMRRFLLCAGGVLLAVCSVPTANEQAPAPVPSHVATPAPVSVSTNRALLNRYCVACHNEKLATAQLMLDKVDPDDVAPHAAIWEKVVRKLRSGAMPPAGRPRPDHATVDAFVTHLETALDRAAAAQPNPGRPVLRRLNRVEYTNAVRDLLGVEIDAGALLPIDEVKYGFDNIGDALSVTPLLLERYMSAAHKISGLAVGEPDVRPSSETYPVDPFLLQEDRMSDDLPFGSRGGIAVRHQFPVDGEYSVKVVLQRNSRGYVRGLFEPRQLDFRLDGERIHLVTIGGGDKMTVPGPPFSQANALGDEESDIYQLTEVDAHLEARFFAEAGPRLVGVTFLHENLVPEGSYRPRMTEFDRVQFKGGDPAIDHIEIAGPFRVTGVGDTPSHRKIFVCRPAQAGDEEPCASKILSVLARRAFRRPVTAKDVQPLMSVYQAARAEGGDFEAGVRAAISRILVGPEFLFRAERDPAGTRAGAAYRLTDLELASRLSFFIWSSLPDDELLEDAEKGRLRDSEVLARQVRRMLADPRASALVTNFASQWLYLRNLSAARPDPELFTEFDESLRDAFRRETELFVESTLREDRSVLALLDADYTFLNERLARHYGIPDVYGSHFRRVTLGPDFDARRGLLGQGSLLTVTSYANRTSVVLRGKWVLENILSAPPPPAPPAVPALEKTGAIGSLPLRQLMEQHRANPVCRACHAPMDPLGFALENFDAVGKWRTVDAGTPVDASAVLPDGTAFEGPSGLRTVLLQRPEQFAGTVAERLLTYAIGRGLEYYDMPAMRQILREAAKDEYRWSALILAVTKSTPFQMRRAEAS